MDYLIIKAVLLEMTKDIKESKLMAQDVTAILDVKKGEKNKLYNNRIKMIENKLKLIHEDTDKYRETLSSIPDEERDDLDKNKILDRIGLEVDLICKVKGMRTVLENMIYEIVDI